MNDQTQLALLSLVQLNTVLVQQGVLPCDTKKEALVAVKGLVEVGAVTVAQAVNVKPVPVVTTGKVDTDLRDKINEATAKSLDAVAKAEIALKDVTNLTTHNRTVGVKMRAEFDTLREDLAARVEAISRPDPARISNEIAQKVSALFDSFREQVTPEQLTVVANALPTFEVRRAADVFGTEACAYGETNFGDLPVAVWNDAQCPALVDDYIFTPEHLHQTLIALDDPLPDNLWLAGERGTGKSEFVSQVAARLKRRLFRVNFDEALERADFIGGNSIESGTVVWKAGIITQAIRTPGAIVLLDEIGFARAQSLAALHALCERSPHRAITISETGERIPVASHVVFFCADNSNGHGDASGNFAGVREQNSAFLDRFSYTLQFQYLQESDEVALITKRVGITKEAAKIIVQFANVAREKARTGLLTQPPSLRQLFAWARSVHKGLPVEQAFKNAVINKFPEDCRAELIGVYTSHINEGQFKLALTKGG